ncbi:MAG: RIP metalloprotease RseP [Candidatus Xiphinematobacter sp.]|nr:MAG: RIP metalloprotease RseP [Candidatus Xiphinematobacter sp.]
MEMVFEAGKTALVFLEVVLIFNFIIIVHELGHFFAARRCGLKVDRFSVWFGPALWKKTVSGVEYRLGCVPAGGFVSIPNMSSVEPINKTPDGCFPVVSPWRKIFVAFSGPLFSLLLAFVFAALVWALGRPISESEATTVIGYIDPNGPAAGAGIHVGDKILAIDGHPVSRFAGAGQVNDTIVWNVARSEKPTIRISLVRGGKRLAFDIRPVVPQTNSLGRKGFRQIGVAPAQLPVIANIFENSPAWQAGLRKRDAIVATNGQKVYSVRELADIIKVRGIQPLKLTVQRAEHTLQVAVTPCILQGKQSPCLGILWDNRGRVHTSHPTPIDQIIAGVQTVWETLMAVASKKSEIKMQHLSGFVGIMRLYYLSFVAPEGWKMALWLSVALNVNVAVLNLFPIPPLDGGHILLSVIEWIRRRPVQESALEKVQIAFTLLLIGFVLYLTFYDIQDFPWGFSEQLPPKR